MIINDLDLSGNHPYPTPVVGQTIGEEQIEGLDATIWPRGSMARKQTVAFWIRAWQGIGGQSADTAAALKYLVKQVEELASNRDMQPVYIQWTATGQGGSLNSAELHDGWYLIEDFEADYHGMDWPTPIVPCRLTVCEVAPGAPRPVSLAYVGGQLVTDYSGGATNLISFPLGSTAFESSAVTRVAAQGNLPTVKNPLASPDPVLLSATISNIFKGAVEMYDTVNTSSNPVPTSAGTYVHANWVKVYHSDHNFVGDCVLTNGLQLLLFQITTAHLATCYLWNTATATANWQQYGTLDVNQAGNTLRSYRIVKSGGEEGSLIAASTGATTTYVTIRLQRGRYEARMDVRTHGSGSDQGAELALNLPAIPKILFASNSARDNVLSDTTPIIPGDYGYGGAFVANSAQPFIAGFLYRNQIQTGVTAPPSDVGNSATIGTAAGTKTASPIAYAVFAIPYGVNASYSTATLQAEAESGSLGTGWTSAVNAAASAGNEAKCASGTLTGNADLWGTAFVPDPGAYNLWVRMKVTSAASALASLQVGLWNSTDGVFVASTTYAPNQLSTNYAFYRVATGVTPTATKSMRVRAVTTNTLPTDFFVDESALIPATLTTDNRGPQDLWQQFIYDRTTELGPD